MRKHALVHHAIPEEREVGRQQHSSIPHGQLRAILKMAQRLKTPHRIGVMIGMALKLIEEHIRHNMVVVPRMLGLTADIAASLVLLPQQSVMLDIIHDFEQRRAIERLQKQETAAPPIQATARSRRTPPPSSPKIAGSRFRDATRHDRGATDVRAPMPRPNAANRPSCAAEMPRSFRPSRELAGSSGVATLR